MLKGPTVSTAQYGLDDVPVFARAGAVVPTRTMGSAYRTTADPLVWMLALHADASSGEGQGEVYEDDGESLDFKSGAGATTALRYELRSSQASRQLSLSQASRQLSLSQASRQLSLSVTVGATNGSFAGMATSRAHWVLLHGIDAAPAHAVCDGVALEKTKSGVAPGWWLAQPPAGPAAATPDEHEVIVSAASLVLACDSAPSATPKILSVEW